MVNHMIVCVAPAENFIRREKEHIDWHFSSRKASADISNRPAATPFARFIWLAYNQQIDVGVRPRPVS